MNIPEYMGRIQEEHEKNGKKANNIDSIKYLSKLFLLRVHGRSYTRYDLNKIVEKYTKNHNLKILYYEIDYNNKQLILHSVLSKASRIMLKANREYVVWGNERIDFIAFKNFNRYKIEFLIGFMPIVQGEDFMLYLEDIEFFGRMYVLNYLQGDFVWAELKHGGKISVEFTEYDGKNKTLIFDFDFVNELLNKWINNKEGVVKYNLYS